jgi:hypothetical protein
MYVRWVFQHSLSWVQAGVWFPEAQLARNARVVIRYVHGSLQCGDVPNALGCTDRQMGPNGQTLIRISSGRLATPDNPQGRFKGILHELGHAAFWATHGVGFAYAQQKVGIMAMGSPEGIWPTEADVSSVRDEGYFGYFGKAAGNPGEGYYSFDLRDWHLIALNSNCAEVGGCTRGSAQGRWLRRDLANHPSRCTLAYFHHPLFTSGEYSPGVREVRPLWKVLYKAGADVILNGHDHNYQRFAPQDPEGKADPERGA